MSKVKKSIMRVEEVRTVININNENNAHIPFISDLGILSGMDIYNHLDKYIEHDDFEEYLKEYTRETTNTLLSELQELEKVEEEECCYIILPKPKIKLPRTQRQPEPKPKTKWEKFASAKGIRKKKRTSKVYNEELDEYIPRYGSKSAKYNKSLNSIKEIK